MSAKSVGDKLLMLAAMFYLVYVMFYIYLKNNLFKESRGLFS